MQFGQVLASKIFAQNAKALKLYLVILQEEKSSSLNMATPSNIYNKAAHTASCAGWTHFVRLWRRR